MPLIAGVTPQSAPIAAWCVPVYEALSARQARRNAPSARRLRPLGRYNGPLRCLFQPMLVVRSGPVIEDRL